LEYFDDQSDVDLLRDLYSIINLDAEITHRALDLGVSELWLDYSKIAGAPLDRHCLRSEQELGAEFRGVETDTGNPLVDEAAPRQALPDGLS
jgi:hypothetical protein